MIITLMTGNESVREASVKVHAFWSPLPGERDQFSGVKEMFMSAAVGIRPDFITVRNIQETAIPGKRKELGIWNQTVYELPEGVVIKLFASKHRAWNKARNTANLFIQIRERAALRKIRVALTQSENTRYKFAEHEGRFDVLSLQDLKTLGVTLNPNFEQYCTQDAIRRVFSIEKIENEVEARVVIERKVIVYNGQKKEIFSRKRTRFLEL